MLRTLICTTLAACAIPGHAETWNFTWQGFHDTVTDQFIPDRTLAGSFTGQDSNGNQAIERAEITSLVLNGYDFVACESQSNEFWQCGTEAFSYENGTLHFIAGQGGSDPEGWVGGGHFYIAGDQEFGFDYRPGQYNEWAYLWTDQTTFAISPAPEPAAWLLLLAGMPLAALAARRRKR